MEEVDIPENVLVTAYRQDNDGKEQILVHLLNATGVRFKKGDPVPKRKSGDAFPALERDIAFDLRSESVGSGFVVSPDFPGKKEIGIESRGKGLFRVTVPKECLKAYAIIYLVEDSD